MKSHCGLYVLGNKTRCMACVTFVFIGSRETELLIEIFNKSSASFLLLSQMAAKLWCPGKKKTNMICINFLAIHCLFPMFFWVVSFAQSLPVTDFCQWLLSYVCLGHPCPLRCCAIKIHSYFLTYYHN